MELPRIVDVRVAGRFKLTKRIGKGAFGDIYHSNINLTLGIDLRTNEEVATKLVLHAIILGTYKDKAPTVIL